MHSVVIPRPERALLLVVSMANLLRALLVLCLCQATAALAREPDVTPEEVGLSSERLARFADYTNAMVESGKIPGATIAISRFGKLAYFETIGWADIDERKPTQADTLHRFSNSYDITGPGSLQAVTRPEHMARWQPAKLQGAQRHEYTTGHRG